MVDTINLLLRVANDQHPLFRCVLTQTTRESVIAKHIRAELVAAGFPALEQEMTNRVIYAEAALWGSTPSMLDHTGAAARDIAAIASELEDILERKQAA
jgi:chromosome partitioning protein